MHLSLLLLGGLKKLQMQVFDQLAGTTGNGLESETKVDKENRRY